MSTYEQRLDAVEKDIAVMKHDIIDKLDETNSAITIIKGVVGAQGLDIRAQRQDIKKIFVQLKGVNVHLESLDIGLEDVRQAVERQGEDIKALKEDMSGFREEARIRDTKLDRIIALLSQ